MSAEVNNYNKVVGMLEKKFSSMREEIDEKYPNIAKEPTHMNITGGEPTSADQVRQSLSGKLFGLCARESNYSGKYAASQYMGKPITELMKDEKRTQKDIEAAERALEEFKHEHLKPYYEAAIKVPGYDEDRAEDYAYRQFKRYIEDGYGENEKDRTAHKEYMGLKNALAECKVEHNAVLTAKSAYLEDNADLIKEMQEKKRREDLLNSGLLDELGLAEKKEPKTEKRETKKAPEEPLEDEKAEEPGERSEEKETDTEAERMKVFNDYYKGKEVKDNE